MNRSRRSTRRSSLLSDPLRAAVLVATLGLFASAGAFAQVASPAAQSDPGARQTAAGFDALAAGKTKRAVEQFAQADEAAEGTSALALVGLAEAHLQLEHYEEAIAAADRLLEIAADDRQRAKAHSVIGRAFFGEAIATEAEAGLTEVSSGEPAEDLRAEAKEQYLAAGDAFRRVVETSGGEAAAPWVSWADALYRAGSFNDARRVLDRLAEALPEGQALPEAGQAIDGCLDALSGPDGDGGEGFLVVSALGGSDEDGGGGAIEPPKKLSAPQPRVPRAARGQRVQGLVVMRAIIDTKGHVLCPRVVRGLPYGLTEAALDAVRKWRFKPARRAGQPVAVYYDLTVGFKLGR